MYSMVECYTDYSDMGQINQDVSISSGENSFSFPINFRLAQEDNKLSNFSSSQYRLQCCCVNIFVNCFFDLNLLYKNVP